MKPILSTIALLLAIASPAVAAQRPNVVLIVSDDQGYRDLGCYGSTEVKTPNLDRLAAEGVRLTSFYVAWPACTPSRGSLLTGRYPQRNGTYDMFRNDLVDFDVKYDEHSYAVSWERIGGMDEREVLLPAVLKQAHYTSGIFGKWDLGQLKRFLPLARGFDEYYGFSNTGIDYYTHERYGVPSMYRGNETTTADQGTYATDLFQRESLRFLDANKGRPFFLYVPFNAPHMASSLEPEIRGTVQAPPEYLALYPKPDPGDVRALRRHGYLASITCMDHAIGKILAALATHGLADNTLVIFFSDNGGGGGSDNSPLRGGKSKMFEGGVRVPCIVRFPGRIPPGTVSNEFLTALEILPTVSAAAGVAPPQGVVLDGFDMMPVLAGKEKSRRNEMFWQRRGDRGARVGNWKWVDSEKGSGLFDLSQDIGEKNDLSRQKPDVLKMVKSRFAAWEKAMAEAEPRGPFRDY
ncbi:MAG: sulfatase-like hydrolase/transferase [Pirellulales bacterium]|nr:sulfatase-like hydrolase/transferase [Pirellulales bacterium]